MDPQSRSVRDSAFESVDSDSGVTGTGCVKQSNDSSLDLLEQQQSKEAALLLQRFRDLRQQQRVQQDKLMSQQQAQIEALQSEQLMVQSLIASRRGAQWGNGRVLHRDGLHSSTQLVTPPRRSTAIGGELARTLVATAAPPHLSTDSGLVASMGLGDTMEMPHMKSLPVPVMYNTSPSLPDEDRYTNPELFSNPGSYGDDLQAAEDVRPFDNASEVGSDNYYLKPPPPEHTTANGDLNNSLKTLQNLLGTSAPNFLHQVLSLLPGQQRALLLEQQQAAVQESASPTFSHTQPLTSQQQTVPSAPARPVRPAMSDLWSAVAPSNAGTARPAGSQAARPLNSGTASLRPVGPPPSLTGVGAGGLPVHPRATSARYETSQQPLPQEPAALTSSSVSREGFSYPQGHPLAGLNLAVAYHQSQKPVSHLVGQALGPGFPVSQPQMLGLPRHDMLPVQQVYSGAQQHTMQSQQQLRQLQFQPPWPHSGSGQAKGGSEHPLPEPQRKLRVSWEEVNEEREENESKRLHGSGGGLPLPEAEEDEMEEEQLEITVRHVEQSPEERPIKPGLQGRKTFEELLEEQLVEEASKAEEEKRREEAENMEALGKHPFLRKGQGIARFSHPPVRRPPKAAGSKKEPSRSSAPPRGSNVGSRADVEKDVHKQPVKRQPVIAVGRKKPSEKDDDRPQPEKLRLIKQKTETGRRSHQQTHQQPLPHQQTHQQPPPNQLPQQQQTATTMGVPLQKQSIDNDKDYMADDASFIASLKKREKMEPLEAEELSEFEALEEIADNMSLVSNSSMVRRLVTPNKQRQKNAVSELQAVVQKKKSQPSSPFESSCGVNGRADGDESIETIGNQRQATTATANAEGSIGLRHYNKNLDRYTPMYPKGIQQVSKKPHLESHTVENGQNVLTVARNAAIRSLLSITGQSGQSDFHTQSGQWREQLSKQAAQVLNDQDDTLVEDDDHFPSTACKTETDVFRVMEKREERGDIRNFDSHITLTSRSDKMMNGLEFSSQFTFFDRQSQSPVNPDLENGGCLEPFASPTKTMTRKVAMLQSRLHTVSDTGALLQKLSAQASILSSGFTPAAPGTRPDAGEENGLVNDSSLLSTSSSRPQPIVIGGGRQSGDPVWPEEEEDDVHGSVSDEGSDSTVEDVQNGGAGPSREGYGQFGDDGGGFNSNNNANSNNNNNMEKNEERGKSANEAEINNHKFDFDDEDEWTTSAPQPTSSKLSAQSGTCDPSADSVPPTSKLMSRIFPNLKPKPLAAQQQQQQKMQMASSVAIGEGVQSRVLREKLAELEAEIEKFRTENAALERLRREREEGVNKLKEEIARFDQEKTAELKRLEEFKAQEMKKLKQERKMFETYQKQVRSMPDKKDREEIDALRRQLGDLQEELKRKESRWSSSLTRLKGQIKELEGENSELREELKMLERKRLELMQSRGPQKTAPPVQQPPAAAPGSNSGMAAAAVSASKPTPHRSSTPSDFAVSNGFHSPVLNGGHMQAATNPPSLSSNATNARHSNGSGAARRSGVGGSGGESMPRVQPATPSMIEGVSPGLVAEGGDGSFLTSNKQATATRLAPVDKPTVDKGNGQYEETQYSDGKVERVYANGSREILFDNGSQKEISSDGQYFIVSFFNGDIKQVYPDQRVVYYYAESQTTQTTYPDKLEVFQFANNQTEKHYPDGTHEITFPDQTVKYLFPNGTEESIFPDGTILRVDKNGEKVLELPNGQREIHTQDMKRREYPDGTVKTLHNDGRQETRYASGRVRLKDKDGNILLDRIYTPGVS